MHKYIKDNPSLQKLTIQTEKNADIEMTMNTHFRGWKTRSCSYERPMRDHPQRVLSPHGRSLIRQGTELGFPLCEGSSPPVSQECLTVPV